MSSLHNKERKAELIENGDFKEFLKLSNFLYMAGSDPYDPECYVGYDEEDLKCLFQLKHQQYLKRSKINKWLDYWKKEYKRKAMYFVTFTFNDEAMDKTVRARKLAVWKNLQCFDDYVLNIDYGGRTNREHYHAITIAPKESNEILDWKISKSKEMYCNDYCLFNFENGFIDLRPVDPADCDALKKYVSKLSSHALKCSQTRLGYKRDSEYQRFIKHQQFHGRLARKYKRCTPLVKGAT